MSDNDLTLAMAELQEVVRCRCDEAYRDRGLKDPHCECDSAEAVKIVARRIEQLVATNEALKAQVADHEKAAQENDPSNLWRFWANKAQEMADNNAAARQDAKEAEAYVEELENEAVLSKAAYEGVSSLLLSVQQDCIKERQRAERREAEVEQFRNTNRRMNRRVQLLEGWWQRRFERAKYWAGVYLRYTRVKGGPDAKAIEEAAYQRGYEDGFEERFRMPKKWARPRRATLEKLKGESHE